MANEKTLTGKRVAILVADNFEQVEMTEPRKALEEAGAITTLIALKPGQVHGFNHDTKGDSFPVDKTFDEAKPADFDAVLLPGGALNADKLRIEPKAQQFVQQFDVTGKPMAIICHAPWLLVSAGLVKGRRLTSFATIQDDIRNAGGDWHDEEVIRDGNWVTSRKPDDIPAFNKAMIELFGQSGAAGTSTTPEQAYSSESLLAANNPAVQPKAEAYRGPDELLISGGQLTRPNATK